MNLQTKLRRLQGGFLSVNRQIVPVPTSKVAYLKQKGKTKGKIGKNKGGALKTEDVYFLGSYRAKRQISQNSPIKSKHITLRSRWFETYPLLLEALQFHKYEMKEEK